MIFREEVFDSLGSENTDIERLKREKEIETNKRRQLQNHIQAMNDRLERLQKEQNEKEE